jgi:putative hydrolase of the HAD superfamily
LTRNLSDETDHLIDVTAPDAGTAAKLRSVEPDIHLAERFAHLDTWVFDLDNTLYPADSDLWPKIDMRITLFMCQLFGIDAISARALQKFYYKQHGTTLNGLMEEFKISPEQFLSFVHDIDRSSLAPNEGLARAIAALPGRKLILTNGSREHALRTSEQLGLGGLFEDIFDIMAADLLPKPAQETYQRFFDKHDVEPARAAMFEDIVHNLRVPHARGMVTALVVPKKGQHDHRETWEQPREIPDHVDFVTDDLEDFLLRITRSKLA